MDFDWAGLFSAAELSLRTWLENQPANKWRGLTSWALYLGTAVPIVIALFISRKIGRSSRTVLPFVSVPAPQAVDFWYQESRRALEARAALTKTIATGAGIGLAAAAAILAVTGVPVGLLYVAVTLHAVALLGCLWSQSLQALGHTQQARRLAAAVTGAAPEENVSFALSPLHTGKQSRYAIVAFFLPALWMSMGWLVIGATMLLSTISIKQ